MIDRELLEHIRRTPWMADLLEHFEFDLDRADLWEEVAMPGGEPFEVVAGDSTGGNYLLVGENDIHPVVYIGSEGEAGLIGYGLRQVLAVLVGLPNLHDAMRISVFEDEAGLLAALTAGDANIREYGPDLDERRARLTEALNLPDAYELLLDLHRAALDERVNPIFLPENTRYRPLLGPDPDGDSVLPPKAQEERPFPVGEPPPQVHGQIGLF